MEAGALNGEQISQRAAPEAGEGWLRALSSVSRVTPRASSSAMSSSAKTGSYTETCARSWRANASEVCHHGRPRARAGRRTIRRSSQRVSRNASWARASREADGLPRPRQSTFAQRKLKVSIASRRISVRIQSATRSDKRAPRTFTLSDPVGTREFVRCLL